MLKIQCCQGAEFRSLLHPPRDLWTEPPMSKQQHRVQRAGCPVQSHRGLLPPTHVVGGQRAHRSFPGLIRAKEATVTIRPSVRSKNNCWFLPWKEPQAAIRSAALLPMLPQVRAHQFQAGQGRWLHAAGPGSGDSAGPGSGPREVGRRRPQLSTILDAKYPLTL